MTFAQLQYLLELHKTRSFSQAAKNLMISQPSLSLMLKSLEKELGHPIFLRTKNGLVPTEEGIDIINHATKICESYRSMTTPNPKKTTSVRISSAPIPPIEKAFTQLVKENCHRRDINFSILQERNNVCIEGLQNFNLEVGFYIVMGSHHLQILDSLQKVGLEAKVLATFPGTIRISEKHPLYHKEQLTLADFEDSLFLDTTNATISKALFNSGITHIKPNHNIVSVLYHVRQDLLDEGLVYDITFFIPSHFPATNIPYRYIPISNLNYKLIVITNPIRSLSPEVRRFLELADEELRKSNSQYEPM